MRYLFILSFALFQMSAFGQADTLQNDVLDFSRVESVPIAYGCDTLVNRSNENLKECFQRYVLKHVAREFKYPEEARKNGIQAKIYVNFVIEKDGSIGQVELLRSASNEYKHQSKAKRKGAKALDKEALRVVRELKIFKPAMQDGDPVRMSFTLPINAMFS